jgi:hypothetical protein
VSDKRRIIVRDIDKIDGLAFNACDVGCHSVECKPSARTRMHATAVMVRSILMIGLNNSN